MSAAKQLALLALAQLMVMALWFSATAVLPQLTAVWGLGPTGAAWLTGAVQLGFVVGALGAAITNLPDVLPPRRLLAVSALLGAALSLALAWGVDSLGPALLPRFYAMWAWLAVFVSQATGEPGRARWIAFVCIGVAGAAGRSAMD